MSIRTIHANESLESIWGDLVYTEARLLKDDAAKDLAPPIAGLLERLEGVQRGQRQAWRAEIIAQAGVDDADDDLDDAVSKVDRALQHAVDHDRTSPRYTRYFKRAPHAVIRMGLQAELEVVRGWPASLASEPEDEVKQTATRLGAAVTSGDAALQERLKAASSRADQRVRELLAFIDDANHTRRSIYGELVKRGSAQRLPKGWPQRFFPKGGQHHHEEPSQEAAQDTPADKPQG